MKKPLDRPKKPPYGVWDLHHVYFGTANRKQSEKYNCVIYLPHSTHMEVHRDINKQLELKRIYQQKLEDAGWTREEVIQTFGRNYLD